MGLLFLLPLLLLLLLLVLLLLLLLVEFFFCVVAVVVFGGVVANVVAVLADVVAVVVGAVVFRWYAADLRGMPLPPSPLIRVFCRAPGGTRVAPRGQRIGCGLHLQSRSRQQ